MLYSMTGYGRASSIIGDKTISAEVRALNSKLTDVKLRYPGDLKEKEPELRKMVQQHAIRGKVDVLLEIQSPGGAMAVNLNQGLFRGYHKALIDLSNELQIQAGDLLQTIVRIPNVVTPPSSDLTDDEYTVLKDTVLQAIESLMVFRKNEGQATAKDLHERTTTIIDLLESITPFEVNRQERMRNRLLTNMEDVIGKDKMDVNRYEQEVMYYLERMDFSEEQMRLGQHCSFFLEQLTNDTADTGRKLNFIAQEMGREINTLGAKAYDSDIQRIIVQMKDELEKIKEQLANIL